MSQPISLTTVITKGRQNPSPSPASNPFQTLVKFSPYCIHIFQQNIHFQTVLTDHSVQFHDEEVKIVLIGNGIPSIPWSILDLEFY